MHKRYMITGATGQLGYDIVRELNNRGIYDVLDLGSRDLDITNQDAVLKIMCDYKPDHVIHCAAYTAVDKAESEKELAELVNVVGTKNITDACRIIDAELFYISTDYVFDGKKKRPYKVKDKTEPLNVYGQTKLLGEGYVKGYEKHFITRISWVFGKNGKGNFVKSMIRLADTKDEISVVTDQIGSPTYTVDAAKAILDIMDTKQYGTYHVHNDGFTTWNQFAKSIMEMTGKDMVINDILTEDYPSAAQRPLNTTMSTGKINDMGIWLPTCEDALERYLVETEEMKTSKNYFVEAGKVKGLNR